MSQVERTHGARAAAEQALVRVVHHYGATPEFVLIGGLVPQLLCARSGVTHAGTTDVDVQVDFEIAKGSTQTRRLERALRNAEFEPSSSSHEWRWRTVADGMRAEVKFELLADLSDQPSERAIRFDECDSLAAMNLRGTGFAARDFEEQELTARIGGVAMTVSINVTGVAGFLCAKTAAARARHTTKDWYDIAFVLLHNDAGSVQAAAERVLGTFSTTDLLSLSSGFTDLAANFADHGSQGSIAYAEQMRIDHPALDPLATRVDAMLAVNQFCSAVNPKG